MGLPTASERGISSAPDVKLTHRMTPQDVQKIARVTGGIVQETGINARTYFGGQKGEGVQYIKYPALDAELNFIGGAISVVLESPQASLKVDKNDISLNNSAVVIGEDAVTFVRRPQSETDSPIPAERNVTVSTVTITKDGITYQKTALQNAGEDVLRAANAIDDAYRARHVARKN